MKKNFSTYLVVAIGIISVYGKCNKLDVNQCSGNCYNITGIVKDSLSGSPIPNAEIELATINPAMFYSGPFGNGFTNSSGVYNLFFPNTQLDFTKNSLAVRIKAPSNAIADATNSATYITYTINASDSPKIGVPIVVNASFLKKAYLNVRIIKTASTLNSFVCRYGKAGYNTISTFPSSSNTDTTYRFETAADVKNYLNWETKDGSVITKFSDSLTITAGQTKDYTIRL